MARRARKKAAPASHCLRGAPLGIGFARRRGLFRLIDVAEGYDAVLLPRGVAVVRELQLTPVRDKGLLRKVPIAYSF